MPDENTGAMAGFEMLANALTSSLVPEGTVYVVPTGSAPTRASTAAEAERWAYGIMRIDVVCPTHHTVRTSPGMLTEQRNRAGREAS